MAVPSGQSITKFANSLMDYLVDVMIDKYGDAQSFRYRYNNLKVYMNPSRISDPHFIVMIGISEAVFSIEDGKKIEGGLGNEETYVKRWAERVNINKELKNHWKLVKEAFITEMGEEDAQRRAMAVIRMRRASNEDLNVDMTGTGLNRGREKKSKRKNNDLLNSKNHWKKRKIRTIIRINNDENAK